MVGDEGYRIRESQNDPREMGLHILEAKRHINGMNKIIASLTGIKRE